MDCAVDVPAAERAHSAKLGQFRMATRFVPLGKPSREGEAETRL